MNPHIDKNQEQGDKEKEDPNHHLVEQANKTRGKNKDVNEVANAHHRNHYKKNNREYLQIKSAARGLFPAQGSVHPRSHSYQSVHYTKRNSNGKQVVLNTTKEGVIAVDKTENHIQRKLKKATQK
jgi:hypothetical protein